jgi:DNA (cytosine-5)-methyltransferase 3A
MNVLSLFDGISIGQVALNKAGIKYGNYYASEIEKNAIKVTQHNYPNTIQIGDVTKVKGKDLPEIYLLMGGSPCVGFSFSGKGLNFDDPRSALFFEFIRLMKETSPKYFLLENVKMKQEWADKITKFMGVDPVEINSALVSAQSRPRLYWTNIPIVGLPEDRNISINSIVGEGLYCGAIRGRKLDPITKKRYDHDKEASYFQYAECRRDNKSNCLTTVLKDNIITDKWVERTLASECNYRYLTPTEHEQLQTLPINYTTNCGVSDTVRNKLIGNAWTVAIISWILKFIPNGN